MKATEPATPVSLASSGLPGTVLHDVASGARVVDVSDAGQDLDRSLIERIGDVVLVCFGTHAHNDCPLDASTESEHGVLFEITEDPAGSRFVRRLSELVRADLPIHIRERKSATDIHLDP